MVYNPFEQFIRSIFQEFLEQGYLDFVLQWFERSNIVLRTGILLSQYWQPKQNIRMSQN